MNAVHRLLRSSLGVAFATLLSRLLGLVRVMFEARVLGGGSVAGAWFLAFSIPNLFRRLLGEGALGTALIPLVTQAENEGGPARVRRELAVVFAALGALLALVVVIVSGAALGLRKCSEIPAVGEAMPLLLTERIQLALTLIPVLMPYAFFLCLVGVIGAVLNTRRIFFLPALGALLLNFFLIGGLAWGWRRHLTLDGLPEFLNTLAVLVLCSGATQLLLMLLLLARSGRFPHWRRGTFGDRSILRRLWHLVLPGLIGQSALQVSFLVDRTLAIVLGPQAVPALYNVDRVVDLPIGIFAIALGSVLMADMARSAAEGRFEKLADDLVFSLRHVYFVCVPMGIAVMFFWEPLIRILCLGNNYTQSDLEATRYVAIFYGAGIPAFCALKVIAPVFYARKQMSVPLKASLCAIAANIVLNFCLMWHLRQGGIALATVLGSMLNNFLLLRHLHGEGFELRRGRLALVFGRSLAFAILIGGPLYAAYPRLLGLLGNGRFGEFPAFAAAMAMFGAGYFFLSAVCGAAEPGELLGTLRRRNASA